jgi:DNA-binding NarL/FixJ family response regulator
MWVISGKTVVRPAWTDCLYIPWYRQADPGDPCSARSFQTLGVHMLTAEKCKRDTPLDHFFLLEPDSLRARTLSRMMRNYATVTHVTTPIAATATLATRLDWAALLLNAIQPKCAGLDALASARACGCESPAVVMVTAIDSRLLDRACDLRAQVVLETGSALTLERFAAASVSRRMPSPSMLLAQWTLQYHLTKTESEILGAGVEGATHTYIMNARQISSRTLQKHIQNLLRKTQDDTLAAAAVRLLRAALAAM